MTIQRKWDLFFWWPIGIIGAVLGIFVGLGY
jgi:hypothetical protein